MKIENNYYLRTQCTVSVGIVLTPKLFNNFLKTLSLFIQDSKETRGTHRGEWEVTCNFQSNCVDIDCAFCLKKLGHVRL
jgi:hypothetical protein